VSGCFTQERIEPKRIEEVRPFPPAFKSIGYTIQRRDLQTYLQHRGDNTIRLVPVYQNAVSAESHVHRVFDLKPKGIYGLLGIQNSDIIVAADGYLIKRPEQCIAYLELLQNEDTATVEIQRENDAVLLKYAFVPAIKSAGQPNANAKFSATTSTADGSVASAHGAK